MNYDGKMFHPNVTYSVACHMVSSGQWGRQVSAPEGLTVKRGHGVHTPCPAGLKVPWGQTEGGTPLVLFLGQACPDGHMQPALEVLPMKENGVLVGQGVQDVARIPAENVPDGQGLQTPSPAALNVPAPQII